ncbi:fatty acid biosynthesis transcriptional regulator FabT [Streptococcus moroccensis]|uniref:DNA-binding MarR family transcriptional regulator n=1 Tax=Streptococcus moroccensis TaxID=1451356 RepID=A0ABT9YT08_9STRE|nr:MarR family transcriptional regulator [Streptococcus moroccensis]MDQ0223124.1 DNA-binding MarR family transcriptional regulator [Streptococcus moroccensis]
MSNELVNEYLTSIFNNVLIIEENSLKTSRFRDLSIKEMHTLDVIGTIPDCKPSDVARTLMVTLGTVTASLNRLEEKGYIDRIRSTKDRRVVHLYLTKKGRLIYRLHRKFHQRMIEEITDGMTKEEYAIMQKGLLKLHAFLEELK